MFVGGEFDFTFARADLDRDDFIVERAGFQRCLRTLHRFDGVGVLVLTAEAVLLHGAFGEHAHGLAVIRVGQAVPSHVVHGLEVAVAVAGARIGDQVRGIGHGLHATRDHDAGRARLDQVMAQHDGLHARTADFVDGGGASRGRQAGGQRGLACRCLAQVGGQHAAHDDFGYVGGRNAGLFQRGTDRGGTQGGRRHAGELAEEGTDRGALGGGDDDVGHGDNSLWVIHRLSRPTGRTANTYRPRVTQVGGWRRVSV